MTLARRLVTVALFLACLAAGLVPARPTAGTAAPAGLPLDLLPAADVGWPPSTSVLVVEIVTGGASASDEWIELMNVAAIPVDLAQLELAYVTSSGSTVTRKAAWASGAVLAPGGRLLLANAAGIHAGLADATYSGGLAATGGALVVRSIGGTPIDAVGWGDASNAFVEGSAAPAPPPGTSIARETLPDGRPVDTNDNAVDLSIDPGPVPEGSGGGPLPSPTPVPSPTATAAPSPSPDPSASPLPTPSPSPDPSASPLPSPTSPADPSPAPSPSPTAAPSQAPPPSPSPLPSPMPSPTVAPSPWPSPSSTPGPQVSPIEVVRTSPDGTSVTIEGVLTTDLGALEAGRGAFVQDATGGIAILLDAEPVTAVPAGRRIRLDGTVDDRYSQRTLRVTALVDLGEAQPPDAVDTATGSAGEILEGRLVRIAGSVIGGPDPLADGDALTVDDGTGPLRVVLAAGLVVELGLARGDRLTAVGPLGQRDSGGTGLTGYRLHVTRTTDVARSTPEPSPEPSAPASPTPVPTSPPSPPADPGALSIAEARTLAAGATVRVRGVVTAEPERLAKPALVPIQDATAAIVVRLPDDVVVGRGDQVEVTGKLADPYGQLEVRLDSPDELVFLGPSAEPLPRTVAAAELGEPLEASLVRIDGRLRRTDRSTAGTISLELDDADGVAFRVYVDPSTGVDRADPVPGAVYRIVGIVGQRASRTGAADGYRVWLRDGEDLVTLEAPATPSPSPTSGASGPDPSPTPAVIGIAVARAAGEATVTIEGVVTAGPSLLDGTGRRIVVEDTTAAVEVLLPEAARWSIGDRIRATGTMGVAYGAARLRARTTVALGPGAAPVPLEVARPLGDRDEWRLARARGVLVELQRMGDRWRAELRLSGGVIIPLAGLAGAGIDPAALTEGTDVSVTGLVRRPYPSASDRRFALVPRGPADLVSAATGGAATGGTGAVVPGAGAARSPGAVAETRADGASMAGGAPAVDLATLAEHLGLKVRVSGLVIAVDGTSVSLDDGTAVAVLRLRGAAEAAAADLRPGDALSVTGRVEAGPGAPVVVVEDPASIILAGGLTTTGTERPTPPTGAPSPSVVGGPRPVAAIVPIPIVAAGSATMAAGLAAVALARRRADRRRWDQRMATRLGRLVGPRAVSAPQGPDGVGPRTGPEPSTLRPTLGTERGGSA